MQINPSEDKQKRGAAMANKFLKLPKVKEATGLSRSSIYASPTFPARVKIGARSVAWIEAEVNEWIAERIDASRSGTPKGKSGTEARASREG